ncbi:hypothetical protein PSENEW3_20000030 (mitochondrion) [Picochlorum sp. SENEW3]|nr:hypothetical protein PSENEW3_20000030 [Picochlorum sp. SENEW3]
MTLMNWATHVLQWCEQYVARPKGGANRQITPQYGLVSATRHHQAGITSNRGSARHGEYVPEPCTPRPSHSGRCM